MPIIRYYGLPLLLAALVLILPGNGEAGAAVQVGQVIALRGQATAVATDGSHRPLQIQGAILAGDRITTDSRCRVQLRFADNTIVSLGPASDFVVQDYAWDADRQQGRMTGRVNEGVFRVLGGSITKAAPENFVTETPAATIGIRGSMYAGRVRGGELELVFQGGKGIFVENPQGRVEISTPGFGTRLRPQQAPPRPFLMPTETLQQLDPLVATAPPPQAPASETAGSVARLAGEQTDLSAAKSESLLLATDTTPLPAGEASSLPAPEPFLEPLTATLVTLSQATSLAQDVAITSTTDTLLQTTTATASTTTTTPATSSPPLTGLFFAVQDDLDPFNSIADLVWQGTINSQNIGGLFSGTASTNNGPVTVDPLPVAGYDPALPYSGANKQFGQTRNLTLLGNPEQFTSAEIASDNTGEFAVFGLDDLFHTPSYGYRELGFAGTVTPTANLPTNGIAHYSGPTLGTLDNLSPTEFEAIGESFDMLVNWHNGRVFGMVNASGKPVGFFLGSVSAGSFSTSLFFGNDITDLGGMGSILAISGSSSFGQFYGDQAQGVGFAFSGNTHSVEFQTIQENWLLNGAGYRAAALQTANSGSSTWQGFAVGVGENMAFIDSGRRLYANQVASDFTLNINRDTGTISGSYSAMDQASPSASINALQIGGSNPSVYISERILAAGLGGGTPIFVSPSSGPLAPQGNYLVSEDPTRQFASYATWGLWEIAYSEPLTGNNYHVHMPASMWIAGEPTSGVDFSTLVGTATYSGQAEGVFVPSSGPFIGMPSGTMSLDVNFGTGMLTSGSINFPAGNGAPAIALGIDPASVTASGFSAAVSSPDFGTINGAFYGPGAKSVAGDFHAILGTDQVIGIFGGDKP